MIADEDFRDLALHYPEVVSIEPDGTYLTLTLAFPNARGTARFYIGDLEVSEARELVEAAIKDCPFRPEVPQ